MGARLGARGALTPHLGGDPLLRGAAPCHFIVPQQPPPRGWSPRPYRTARRRRRKTPVDSPCCDSSPFPHGLSPPGSGSGSSGLCPSVTPSGSGVESGGTVARRHRARHRALLSVSSADNWGKGLARLPRPSDSVSKRRVLELAPEPGSLICAGLPAAPPPPPPAITGESQGRRELNPSRAPPRAPVPQKTSG